MSKLGLHIISWNQSGQILDFIAKAQPRVIKMMEFNDSNTDAARASSPGTLFIGRQFVNNQPLDNPTANARDFMNLLQPAIQKMGKRIDIWEAYNEIGLGSADDAKRYSDFTVEWAGLMHAQGLKCAAYSFSTANPDLQYWPYLVPGAQACDYLALHEYDHPRMDTNEGDFCLRYQRARAALPAAAQRPIIITECGIDDGQNQGWIKYAQADDYLAQLAWYDSQIMTNDYLIGATIFTVDGKDWRYFDVLSILGRIADYIAAHPQPPAPPPVTPPPLPPIPPQPQPPVVIVPVQPPPQPQPPAVTIPLPMLQPAADLDKARWWTEEATRQLEANQPATAHAILANAVTPWFYASAPQFNTPLANAQAQTAARWYTEEATRQIEANNLTQAHTLLKTQVIPWFYAQ